MAFIHSGFEFSRKKEKFNVMNAYKIIEEGDGIRIGPGTAIPVRIPSISDSVTSSSETKQMSVENAKLIEQEGDMDYMRRFVKFKVDL